MSQEMVEIVRRGYAALVEALGRGDLERGLDEGGFDAFFEWLDPNIEWRGPREFPDLAEPRFGHEGVRDYVATLVEGIADYRMVPEEFIDAGDDQVLVFSREGGRGGAVVRRSSLSPPRTSGRSETGSLSACTASGRARAGSPRALARVPHDLTSCGHSPLPAKSEALGSAAQPATAGRIIAVSQQKLEAVRNVVVALNERDVDGYLACCTDDVELVPATAAIAGTYRGASGIQRFFADLQDTAPDIQVEIERLELVGGSVLAFERGSASGRATGIGAELEFTTLYEFAGGRVRRISVFLDRQEATEAARVRDGDSG